MNEEELKIAIKARQPFEPLRIHLSNGTTFDIEHPDAILISPRTSAILVNGVIHFVSNLHINLVEPLMRAGAGDRGRNFSKIPVI